jgi:hypothetical protein
VTGRFFVLYHEQYDMAFERSQWEKEYLGGEDSMISRRMIALISFLLTGTIESTIPFSMFS